jgi:hypothetical protein
MSSRFCHQLEDYRVISFIEGKEVLLGGAGPASVSHVSINPLVRNILRKKGRSNSDAAGRGRRIGRARPPRKS